MIKKATQKCFVPLTIGGGITNVDHIKELMHSGADKIALNQSALYKPKLITEAANIFGNQSLVVSIDCINTADGYRVYDYLQKKTTIHDPSEFARKVEEAGAGEILINSVDRDGSYLGYDLELVEEVCSHVRIPVIACGGAKNASHMIDVLTKTNASAASAGNFFHFTEHSVNITKSHIQKYLDVRLDTHANYADNVWDDQMRLIKKDDEVLEYMMYINIEKEII